MKGIKCDYCGKFISEHDAVYSKRMTCGLYCSLLCCAKDQFDYQRHILDDDVLDNCAHEWIEVEE